MARILALALGITIVLSGAAFATCARVGSQVDCDWSGLSVRLGTQTRRGSTTSALHPRTHGFAGPVDLGRTTRPPGTLVLSVQSFSNDPHSCRRLGNETYCW